MENVYIYREEIAEHITDIVGKPITQARKEIDMAVRKAKLLREISTRAFKPQTLF
jgi:acyl-CoA reductase-like NAD-dependent aldehyde dehydrogenase